MTEQFTYNTEPKIIRKKTFSGPQRLLLSSLWLLVSGAMIGGIVLQQNGTLPQNTAMLLVIIFLPLLLAAALSIYLILHPHGPEKDFELPAIEVDDADSSTVAGKVTLSGGVTREVEVKVPNVYGAGAINILSDTPEHGSSSGLAGEEMAEMALEEVRRKYPDSEWTEVPRVVQH